MAHLNYGWREREDGVHGKDSYKVLCVKSHCLPVDQVPHTTRLYSDFLSRRSEVQAFYPHSPLVSEWEAAKAASQTFDPERRERIAGILSRQNRSWGASAKTIDNLARLRAGACAIVTGQQVGLFGGPLFAFLKALTAIRLAAEVSASGHDCVPIFWLATEDHDFAEINHATLADSAYQLRALGVEPARIQDAPVGSIPFGPEISVAVDQAAEILGETDAVAALRESYRPGENFGSAFARLFTRTFAEWGLILLDPADSELHHLAAPVYRRAIEHAGALDSALLARGKQLEQAGYHQQVKVTAATSLLFKVEDGVRRVVRRTTNGGTDYLIGSQRIGESDLLAEVASAPEQFSANVLLRPVMQDYLLPTLAYVGGPAEVAYFAQAAVVYEQLLGKATPVIPRFSATLVEPKPESLLERYHLALPDLFCGPEALAERIATGALPAEVQAAFAAAERRVESGWDELHGPLARLDPTLVDASNRARSKVLYQLRRLATRAGRAELRRTEVLSRHARVLSNMLFPHKMLQERQLAGIYFLSRYGKQLLRSLHDTLQVGCLDHQVITEL